MARRRIVAVPHTHWDREWYRTHEAFRYRLVGLLDRLLDLLERDPEFRHFTLDGQTIVVEDYLEVRPEAAERIAKLVRQGRLLVGPWYVLPDEWLVSGEALIRNLRLGLEQAQRLGAAMRVGYVPDQFGHVGQLPQLFAGFGFESAVLWRGVGGDVEGPLFTWEAPDGTRLRTVYLRRGYSNGMHLPLEPAALAARLRSELDAAGVSDLLLMCGSDHLEPEPALPRALAAASARLDDVDVVIGTLPDYCEATRPVTADLPLHRGELRSGLRAPLLEGCASARMPQKRSDFANDVRLTRYAEPLAAWLEAVGGDGDPAILALAWRVALQNHPHDSICGCSIDAVHDQMETRFARVADLVDAHLARIGRELAARIARPADAEGHPIAVWNPGAGGPAEADGVVELPVDAGEGELVALHLRDARGRPLALHAEVVAPAHTFAEYAVSAAVAGRLLRAFPAEFFGSPVCALRRVREGEREIVEVALGEQPPPGLHWERERERVAAELASEGETPVVFRPRRLARVRLRFCDDFPGAGLRRYDVRSGPAGATTLRAEVLAGGGAAVSNATWRVEVDAAGCVRCTHRPSGAVLDDALRLVSEADRGDEYTFDPLPAGERVERPVRARVALGSVSQARAEVLVDAVYSLPVALDAGRAARAAERVDVPVRLAVALAGDLDRVEIDLRVDNTARDQRLRLLVGAPFEPLRLEVESAFEVVERAIAPAPDAFGTAPAERPTGACPQRSFATLVGDALALSVASRGCAEVEALRAGDPGGTALALTVLRAVGWLSRDDLAMRPGHAGPPLATPGAQVPGLHRLEASFRWHAPGEPERLAAAHRYAAPPLAFAGAGAPDAPLRDGARLVEVDDPQVVISAIEPRRGAAPLLRLLNASDEPRRVALRWNGAGEALQRVDLAGRALGVPLPAEAGGANAELTLRPWELASLRPL